MDKESRISRLHLHFPHEDATLIARAALVTKQSVSEFHHLGRHGARQAQADDNETELYFRDLTNKVLHSVDFKWDFTYPKKPVVTAATADLKRWKKATVSIVSLGALCGMFMN
jgi:hypothetical protein